MSIADSSLAPETRDAADAAGVVTAELRRRILMGGLAPGAPLQQELLAADFGVSRMPIRQALKRLQEEGLLERRHTRRVHVSELRRDEIEDIFDMRIALEPLAFTLAVDRATRTDVRAMARALEDTTDDEPSTFGMRNTAFHLALVRPCGRPRLLREIHSLLDLSDRYQRAAQDDATFRAPLDAEHDAMLGAVADGDADAGADVLARHIRQGRDRLVELFSAGTAPHGHTDLSDGPVPALREQG